jgi:MscS family membrane protein
VERSCRYFESVASRPYRTDAPEVTKDFYRWYQSVPGHPALAAVIEKLPEQLRLGRTLGLVNWKWLGLLVTVLSALGLSAVAFRAYTTLSKRIRKQRLYRYWLTIFFPIFVLLMPLAVKYVSYRYLTLRGAHLYYLSFICILVALLAAIWVIFAVSNRIAASYIASPHINPEGLNAQLIRVMAKLTSGLAAVILFLVGGQYLGINLATLLASAGIGGVAVALAAQDTLKTLFGTLTLLSDKPFRVGERIIVKQYDGVVEDIGIRSTSMRLLRGPQVTIPNDLLAGNDIQNVSRRPHIRRTGEIHIPLDTQHEKVEQAVEIVRDELQDHEGMTSDHPPRVFFHEFTPGAFCIKFDYWYTPPDRWKCKAFSDRLHFAIFRKFESQGIQFSLPLRHSFWKRDDEQGPLDIQVIDPPRNALIRSRDDNEY